MGIAAVLGWDRLSGMVTAGWMILRQGRQRSAWHGGCYDICAADAGMKPARADITMPKIENSTMIKHAKPICDALNKAGKNWNWEAQAALTVRVVLEEMGAVEQLGEDFKADRQALVKLLEKMNYPKNFQDVYLAKTEVDGKPLMSAVGKNDAEAVSEWA